MVFKGLIAAAAAVALAATPAVAASNNAAAASRAATQVAPAGETVEGSQFQDGDGIFENGIFIPIAVIVVIVLGVLVFVKDNDGGTVSVG